METAADYDTLRNLGLSTPRVCRAFFAVLLLWEGIVQKLMNDQLRRPEGTIWPL